MRELVELRREVAKLPPSYQAMLTPHLGRIEEAHKRRAKILNMVQECLATLRLDVKYLLFDLEATRKERDELREKLNGH